MIRSLPFPEAPGRWRRRWMRAALIGLLVFGAIAHIAYWAERPVTVLGFAAHDDALFMSQAESLLRGAWLGSYSQYTFAKGPAFPIFLALANLSGLSFGIVLGTFHLAAILAFAAAILTATRSRIAAAMVLVALLLSPALHTFSLARVVRDGFYVSLTLFVLAGLIALVFGDLPRWRRVAIGTGLAGALFYLTREEAVWLAPTIAVIVLGAWIMTRSAANAERRVRAGGIAVALLVAAAAVATVGLVNRVIYGRFVINEIKDSAFQGALGALQRASDPFFVPYMPVPRAARNAIYEASPTFARLRDAIEKMDADNIAHCSHGPHLCHDLAGGWFLWFMREAAASIGVHANPSVAARFYRAIEREVDEACAAGRLACARWLLPLVPPISREQAALVPGRLASALRAIAQARPWTIDPSPSVLRPDDDHFLTLLNRPVVDDGRHPTIFSGWYRAPSGGWFGLKAGPGVEITNFDREASPDVAAHFGDPAASRLRFTARILCPRAACPVTASDETGGSIPLDLAPASGLGAGGRKIGAATLQIDRVERVTERANLRTGLHRLVRALIGFLQPLYFWFSFAGLAAYAFAAVLAIRRRTLSAGFVVATALGVAVLSRAGLLALIDISSFPAINDLYAAPAVPLLAGFAALAIAEAAGGIAALRAPRA